MLTSYDIQPIFPPMLKKFRIALEKSGKAQILRLVAKMLSQEKNVDRITPGSKVLVFRLDQRLGNGLMLLPLVNSIYYSGQNHSVDLLINKKVADFFTTYQSGQIRKIWPYDQHRLLSRPWKFIALLRKLRKEHYQLLLSSTNPDSFSVSQALFGRIIRPGIMAGFKAKEAEQFYDVAVFSSTKRHYTQSMVDLWRHFDREASYIPGHLDFSEVRISPKVLFWLGATGGKHLRPELVQTIVDLLHSKLQMETDFAIGPADQHLLKDYPESIQEKIIIDKGPLNKSASFFRGYALFVSTDTGPMHLAATIDMPTIAIFTKKMFEQYGYNDEQKHFTLFYDPKKENLKKLSDSLDKVLSKIVKIL